MRRRYRGQSIVEFALLGVFIVSLLVITVDFARVFSAYIMVGNMARAGAQTGSVVNQLGAADWNDAVSLIREAAYAEQDSIFGTVPDVDAETYTDGDNLCVVRVTVDYRFEPIILFPPIDRGFTISRTAEMRGQIMDLCD